MLLWFLIRITGLDMPKRLILAFKITNLVSDDVNVLVNAYLLVDDLCRIIEIVVVADVIVFNVNKLLWMIICFIFFFCFSVFIFINIDWRIPTIMKLFQKLFSTWYPIETPTQHTKPRQIFQIETIGHIVCSIITFKNWMDFMLIVLGKTLDNLLLTSFNRFFLFSATTENFKNKAEILWFGLLYFRGW